ncbi:MAG: Flagellar protein FliS [Clostridia bacterium 62_21]|nr:MAG: Flagellar protein FliS [Clostridia bacterium 62_21]HAG07331.1 flagellar export chaperone FliS [Peptococcaceae bacterium]
MQGPNPYQQYRENAVLTADQGRLALMLFEGAARFAREAAGHIAARNPAAAHAAIVRAQDIVEYLAATVNPEIEVGRNLAALYDFIHTRLVEANAKKDTAPLGEAIGLIEQLRDTWREALDGGAQTEDKGE